jgi:hypothetical protein
MVDSMIPELARTFAVASKTGGTPSNILLRDDLVNLISNSVDRLLTAVRDRTRGAPSQVIKLAGTMYSY